MQLTIIDWLVIAAYFALNVAIGFYYKSRASSSVSEFFVAGRNVPWWLAGTSMVATTFAADTPLVVTGFVAKNGIAGNWIWWSFLMSGMLTVFFYARLWRRAGVMTDIEFAEIRYSGKPAAFLRGFRSVYLGVIVNCIILGWVNLAMVKILGLIFGITKGEALLVVLGLIALTSFISTLSGLWGVLVTDMVQFVTVRAFPPLMPNPVTLFEAVQVASVVVSPTEKPCLRLPEAVQFASVFSGPVTMPDPFGPAPFSDATQPFRVHLLPT